MKASEPSLPFSFTEFNTMIGGIELLFTLGRRVSDAMAKQFCEYLIQEASMAFAKTMMSVHAFLRFIPSSRFHAKEGEYPIDLSSASIMARQVLEDAISFFYLSEPNLTVEQKVFRELVWRLHAATEAIDSATFANIANPGLSQTTAERDRVRQRLNEPPFNAMLETIEPSRRRNIRRGRENHVLHDKEVLALRGIRTNETYSLWLKVLSNFAHFSALSHRMIMNTTADWQKSWTPFLTPALCVASFGGEAVEVFLETFPPTRQLLRSDEQAAVANLRSWLRNKEIK
jgi:hypothetical protein